MDGAVVVGVADAVVVAVGIQVVGIAVAVCVAAGHVAVAVVVLVSAGHAVVVVVIVQVVGAAVAVAVVRRGIAVAVQVFVEAGHAVTVVVVVKGVDQAVAIRVGRVGDVANLGQVVHAVAVAVGRGLVGAQVELGQVGQAVAVGVGVGADRLVHGRDQAVDDVFLGEVVEAEVAGGEAAALGELQGAVHVDVHLGRGVVHLHRVGGVVGPARGAQVDGLGHLDHVVVVTPKLVGRGDLALDAVHAQARVAVVAVPVLVALLPVPQQPVGAAGRALAAVVADDPADEVVVGAGVDCQLEAHGYACRGQRGHVDRRIGVFALGDGQAVGGDAPGGIRMPGVGDQRLVEVQREGRVDALVAFLDGAGGVAAIAVGGVEVVAFLAAVQHAVAADGVGQARCGANSQQQGGGQQVSGLADMRAHGTPREHRCDDMPEDSMDSR